MLFPFGQHGRGQQSATRIKSAESARYAPDMTEESEIARPITVFGIAAAGLAVPMAFVADTNTYVGYAYSATAIILGAAGAVSAGNSRRWNRWVSLAVLGVGAVSLLGDWLLPTP